MNDDEWRDPEGEISAILKKDRLQLIRDRVEREVRGEGMLRADGGRSDAFTLMEDALRTILEPGRGDRRLRAKLVFAEIRGVPWLWYEVDKGMLIQNLNGHIRRLPVAPDCAWHILMAANTMRDGDIQDDA